MGKTVFISDVHIKGLGSPEMKTICSFLDSLVEDTKTLVIAGDLFDFWIGCKEVVYYDYLPVLNILIRLKNKGIRIVYIEGNHDFFMGPFFTEVLEAEVCSSEKDLEVDGKKIYIAHGDRVNKKDYSYRLWRWFLRGGPFRFVVGLIPSSLLFKIGGKMSKASRRYHRRGSDLKDILEDFARKKWEEGYHGVIMGHLHTPQFIEEDVYGKPRFYVNLGDWIEHHTYLVSEGGRFRLESFKNKKEDTKDPSLMSSMVKQPMLR